MRLLVPGLAVILCLGLLACANDHEDPEPFAISEEAELTALAIDIVEPVADEGDAVFTGDVDEDEIQADLPDPDAEENPVDEDPDGADDVAVETEDAKEKEEDVTTTTTTTMSLHVTTDGTLPKGEKRASLASKKWKCKRKTNRSCLCKGSPMNCQFPNDQPGRNRYLPPVAEAAIKAHANQEIDSVGRWQIADKTALFDGAGHLRSADISGGCYAFTGASGKGTERVDGTCVAINFGQKKTMKVDGDSAVHTYVYAFNVTTPSGGASSWIPLANVTNKATLTKMPRIVSPSLKNFAAPSYVLKSAEDWNQRSSSFASKDLPAWTHGKVAKPARGQKSSNMAASDYLLRDGLVMNLCYSTPGLGGVANDTLSVPGAATVAFRRIKSTTERPTLIRVPLAAKDRSSMLFAYGSIGGRFGWVATASLKQGTVKPVARAATGASCGDQSDGFHCDPSTASQAMICANGGVRTTLTCATAGQHCVGPNDDGTGIVCAP